MLSALAGEDVAGRGAELVGRCERRPAALHGQVLVTSNIIRWPPQLDNVAVLPGVVDVLSEFSVEHVAPRCTDGQRGDAVPHAASREVPNHGILASPPRKLHDPGVVGGVEDVVGAIVREEVAGWLARRRLRRSGLLDWLRLRSRQSWPPPHDSSTTSVPAT